MVCATIKKCDLCGNLCNICRQAGHLQVVSYQSYAMHGDPARSVKLSLCRRCLSGWDGHGGMFEGGSRLAHKMLKNLHKITKRPFQWSLHLPPKENGAFSIHEGTVMPGMKASDF